MKKLKDPYQSRKRTKKIIGLMKDEFDGEIIRKLQGLKPKICSYIKDNDREEKRQKLQKNIAWNGKLCLKTTKIV